jgi:hypothetical protein
MNASAPAGGSAVYAMQLATLVEAQVRFIATNNYSTWHGGDTVQGRQQATTLAASIDAEETRLLNTINDDIPDDDSGFEADAGLMASLVHTFHAGNCDDIAAYTAHLCLLQATQPVAVCVISASPLGHSFVLLQSAPGQLPTQLDCWVPQDRIVQWDVSRWRSPGQLFTMNIRTRGTQPHAGLIAAFAQWQQTHRGTRNIPVETPRVDQVGTWENSSGRRSPSPTPRAAPRGRGRGRGRSRGRGRGRVGAPY